MKNNFKRTFGFHIGNMKLIDIKPMDVQKALNAMEKRKISNSAMREALGRSFREAAQRGSVSKRGS